MRDLLTAPAEAYAPDADRAGSGASAQIPEWLVRCLVLLILFMLEHLHAARLRRYHRLAGVWPDRRPDLPAGSTQSEAASIRGPFGNAIAWMCRRHGVGPGHKDWPELSRAIVAFGGSLKRFRAGAPALGLQWWDNPNVVPGTVTGFGVPAETATLLQRQAAANAASPALNPMQARAVQAETGAHARLPASWSLAPVRHVLARAGPSPPTGPPRCPGLLTTVMADARGRSMASPAVLIRAD
jgi:hypothetical protein